jgi:hypothetical protein
MDVIQNALIGGASAALFATLVFAYQKIRAMYSLQKANADPHLNPYIKKMEQLNEINFHYNKSIIADMADVLRKKEYTIESDLDKFGVYDFHFIFMAFIFSGRVRKYFSRGNPEHKIAEIFGESIRSSRSIVLELNIYNEASIKQKEIDLFAKRSPIRSVIFCGNNPEFIK